MPIKPMQLDLDDAIALYEAGETLEEVAHKAGVCGITLARRMDAAGYKRRVGSDRSAAFWRERTPDLTPFFDRYRAGEGYVALAREAGIGSTRFARLLRESGVPLRSMRRTVSLRYTRMSAEERAALTRAANTAKRGARAKPESLARRALTMEATLQLASRADLVLAVWLAQRGVEFTLQKAVGPYNVDIAVHEPRVAVEVNGFHHDPRLRRLSRSRSTPAERRDYLLNRGWRLIEVAPPKRSPETLSPACADYVISLLEEARAGEPAWGEYCVIRGDGEPFTGEDFDLDDGA